MEAQIDLYWSSLELEDRKMVIGATGQGLAFVSLMAEPYEELLAWSAKRGRSIRLREDKTYLAEYAEQIAGYFAGERRSFSLPLDLIGTPFQRNVWRAVAEVPFGEVRTYADIAEAAGAPRAVRAVGAANGANPVPVVVPCHRIIGANGTLTGYRGGLALKERLLRLEGIRDWKPQGHARFRF